MGNLSWFLDGRLTIHGSSLHGSALASWDFPRAMTWAMPSIDVNARHCTHCVSTECWDFFFGQPMIAMFRLQEVTFCGCSTLRFFQICTDYVTACVALLQKSTCDWCVFSACQFPGWEMRFVLQWSQLWQLLPSSNVAIACQAQQGPWRCELWDATVKPCKIEFRFTLIQSYPIHQKAGTAMLSQQLFCKTLHSAS